MTEDPDSISVLIAFDIRNAFNTAPWNEIVKSLRNMQTPEYLTRMIESYLSHRRLLIGDVKMELSCGFP